MREYFDQLRGQKVFLRPFLASDITPEYVSWLNDPDVVRYSNQRFIEHTLSSCHAYWESFHNTPNLFVSVRCLENDSAIGTMTGYVSLPHQTVDIGILIGRKSVWGSGMGQDAWDTLLTWFIGQQGIRKVTAGTLGCNKAMLRVMERSGMHCEAIRPKHELLDGKPEDIHYYGKYSQRTTESA